MSEEKNTGLIWSRRGWSRRRGSGLMRSHQAHNSSVKRVKPKRGFKIVYLKGGETREPIRSRFDLRR